MDLGDKNEPITSCHLVTSSAKREGSPSNPSFPHSLTFSSPPFLFLSSFFPFFLFMIGCFVPCYLAGGNLGRRWVSCRLNCSFPFIIAFCFGFFSHFPHSPMFPLSSCFVCATVPPTRRHHRRPCGGLTSLGLALVMLGWAHHPSWWFPLCRAVLGN